MYTVCPIYTACPIYTICPIYTVCPFNFDVFIGSLYLVVDDFGIYKILIRQSWWGGPVGGGGGKSNAPCMTVQIVS